MGAAIAAGNHAENGIWALFVVAASVISRSSSQLFEVISVVRSWLSDTAIIIDIIKRASPPRLVRTVSMAAPVDLGFW